MTPNVPTRLRGTATLGITVAERVRRKRKITSTTRATVSMSSNWTSSTEARIVSVRSARIWTLTEEGRADRRAGRRALIRSTTPMMLAPGWRWMLTSTAGRSFIHAACLAFSAPSTTFATSWRRTGAPAR